MIRSRARRGARAAADGAGRVHRCSGAVLATLIAAVLVSGCASTPQVKSVSPGYTERGVASWYGGKFHGRATASGEVYDMHELTAAHKTLPLGTIVDVKNLDNGREVRVKVNDRGPFVRGRILDLSFAAAKRIGMVGPGTAQVRIQVVSVPSSSTSMPIDKHTRWVVQAGSFEDRDRALAMKLDLERDFGDVRIRQVSGLHRVEIGGWKKRRKAEKVAKKLRKRGYEALVKATTR